MKKTGFPLFLPKWDLGVKKTVLYIQKDSDRECKKEMGIERPHFPSYYTLPAPVIFLVKKGIAYFSPVTHNWKEQNNERTTRIQPSNRERVKKRKAARSAGTPWAAKWAVFSCDMLYTTLSLPKTEDFFNDNLPFSVSGPCGRNVPCGRCRLLAQRFDVRECTGCRTRLNDT